MPRWSIRGFSTGRQNYYSQDIPVDRFTDPERRLEGETLRDRKGKPLSPEKVATARIDTLTSEPDRVFIRYVDARTGRPQHVWIYLEDFGTSWRNVDWNKVTEHLERQYDVRIEPEEEPKQAPTPPPVPEEPIQAPTPKPKKKRTVWDIVGEGVRKIFNPEWPTLQPPSEPPKKKKKRSIWGNLPEHVRNIFRPKR